MYRFTTSIILKTRLITLAYCNPTTVKISRGIAESRIHDEEKPRILQEAKATLFVPDSMPNKFPSNHWVYMGYYMATYITKAASQIQSKITRIKTISTACLCASLEVHNKQSTS